MAVILLKNLKDKVNILEQQNSIITYASKQRISIKSTEIETSDSSKKLEQRSELKGFLRSLDKNATLLIYDFWVLSSDVGELVKIIECLFKRDIALHLCIKKEIIDNKINPLALLTLLANERKSNSLVKGHERRGRPVGRMSLSKFDKFRSKIIFLLEEGTSVSKIAQELKVSRTSLKDYINSRNLKTLAKTKKELLGATPKPINRKVRYKKKCDLIHEKN